MAKNWKHRLAVFNTRYQSVVNMFVGAFLGAAFAQLINNNIFLYFVIGIFITALILNNIAIKFTFKNCPSCGRILSKSRK